MSTTNIKNRKVTFLTIFCGIFIYGLLKFLYKEFYLKKPKPVLSQAFNKENIMPVVILGSGPAGQSAGIYASRLGFKTLIFEGSKAGGQLTETSFVENWPGEKKILGQELMNKLKEHNLGLNVSYLPEDIVKVNFGTWPFELWTSDGVKINALSVIIATGSSPRILKIQGEKEYWGKGVTTCAICDAPFYKNKNVVVVGGGDSAAEQVLQLSPHVAHITMLVRKDQLRSSKSMQDRIHEIKNLTIQYNKELKKIIGDGEHVTQVEILDANTHELAQMKIDGVFLAIGHEPNSAIFKGQINMDSAGYIKLKRRSQKTSVPGIFAAGDIEDHVYMQAGVASGSGIKAALDAGAFLHELGFNNEIAQKLQNNYFDATQTGVSQVVTIKSFRELQKILSDTKTPVILDFWAEHCPTCKHMLPTFESLSKKFSNKMKFIKINADEAKDLVEKLFVLKVPSFIVYKEGQIVARYHDFMNKSQMSDFIEQFI